MSVDRQGQFISDLEARYRVKFRRLADGSILLVRPNKELEAYLDKQCVRIAGESRWLPQWTGLAISNIYAALAGKSVAIVGRGESLTHLREIDDDVAVGVNWAANVVAKLHPKTLGIQTDHSTAPYITEPVPILASTYAAYLYKGRPVYVFDADRSKNLSARHAIAICKAAGARSVSLYCFDAITRGCRLYAPVGRDGSNNPDLVHHRRLILEELEGVPHRWVTPNPRGTSSVSDTP